MLYLLQLVSTHQVSFSSRAVKYDKKLQWLKYRIIPKRNSIQVACSILIIKYLPQVSLIPNLSLSVISNSSQVWTGILPHLFLHQTHTIPNSSICIELRLWQLNKELFSWKTTSHKCQMKVKIKLHLILNILLKIWFSTKKLAACKLGFVYPESSQKSPFSSPRFLWIGMHDEI